jgi:hypothetical protein
MKKKPARVVRAGLGKSIFLGEIFLSGPADRTGPIIGDVFELGAGGHAVVRIAAGGVVNVAAEGANILIHAEYLL